MFEANISQPLIEALYANAGVRAITAHEVLPGELGVDDPND